MIAGTLVLEDHTIVFAHDSTANTVDYTISDSVSCARANITCPAPAFFAALSIALHHDGSPNAERDYPDAEAVMPLAILNPADEKQRTLLSNLRWIP